MSCTEWIRTILRRGMSLWITAHTQPDTGSFYWEHLITLEYIKTCIRLRCKMQLYYSKDMIKFHSFDPLCLIARNIIYECSHFLLLSSWGWFSIAKREPGFSEMTFELKWTHTHIHTCHNCTHSSSFNLQPAPPSIQIIAHTNPVTWPWCVAYCNSIDCDLTPATSTRCSLHCIWFYNNTFFHRGNGGCLLCMCVGALNGSILWIMTSAYSYSNSSSQAGFSRSGFFNDIQYLHAHCVHCY